MRASPLPIAGAWPAGQGSTASFANFLSSEIRKWGNVIREAGITIN